MRKGRSDHHQMIKNIFPFILFFSFVSPISWTSNGEMFSQFKTLENLSSQSSKILTDFQGKDRLDTQRNESSPRNRINNLKINDGKSLSEINKKALLLPKSSRAFLMSTDIIDVSRVVATLFVHPVRLCKLCYTPKTVGETVGESGIAQVELEKALEISNECYPNSGHLKVDKVIERPSLQTSMMFLPAITQQMHLYKWEEWRTR